MSKNHMAPFLSLVIFLSLALAPTVATGATLTESGSAVATGKTILGTSSSFSWTSVFGTVTCTTATMTASVHQNSGGLFKLTISSPLSIGGTGTVGANGERRCTSTFPLNPQFEVKTENLHWCIENESAISDTFVIQAKTCTESVAPRNVRFTWTSSLGNCTYEAAQMTGTFVTNTTPGTLALEKQKFTRVAGGGSCPESTELKVAWTLETDESPFTALSIS
ncbi:MAG TPA: hypothetical protein VFP17_02190 [Solirubrobacterales bacterium]|nr:hypothetical protein [Solirubrobacterales bacterium]